jgi:DNA-binding NtrC family response regulator
MKKILIADPDEVLAVFYSEELSEEGYQVTACSDRAELMHVIMSERPDLILIDTQMVPHPGEGFYHEIENYLPEVPSILYTSSLRSKPKKGAIPSGNFVRKTPNLKSLKHKITSVFSARRIEKKQEFQIPQEQMAFQWLNDGKA